MHYGKLYKLLDDIEVELIDFSKHPLLPPGLMERYFAFIKGDIRGRKMHPEAEVPAEKLARFQPVLDWYRNSLESRL